MFSGKKKPRRKRVVPKHRHDLKQPSLARNVAGEAGEGAETDGDAEKAPATGGAGQVESVAGPQAPEQAPLSEVGDFKGDRSTRTRRPAGTSTRKFASKGGAQRAREARKREKETQQARRRGILIGAWAAVMLTFLALAGLNYKRNVDEAKAILERQNARMENPPPGVEAKKRKFEADQEDEAPELTSARNRYLFRSEEESTERAAAKDLRDLPRTVEKTEEEKQLLEEKKKGLIGRLMPYSEGAREEERNREVSPEALYIPESATSKPEGEELGNP